MRNTSIRTPDRNRAGRSVTGWPADDWLLLAPRTWDAI